MKSNASWGRNLAVIIIIVLLVCVLGESETSKKIAGLIPTNFAGLSLTVVPNFIPAERFPGIEATISSKWEDAQHKVSFFIIQADSTELASDFGNIVADTMIGVLADKAWIPRWKWIPHKEIIEEKEVSINWAEGMGYGFPTCAGVAFWVDGNLAWGMAITGPADEYDYATLLRCTQAWTKSEKLVKMPVRDSDKPSSPYHLLMNSRELQYFNPGTSLNFALQALPLFEHLSIPLWIAATKLQIGRMYLEAKQLDKATIYLTQALNGFQEMHSKIGQVTTLAVLSTLSYLEGNLKKALKNAEAAYNIANVLKNSPSILTSDILTLKGCIYFRATLWNKARDEFEEALAQDEKLDDTPRAARDLNNLAVFNLAIGDYPTAFKLLNKALEVRPYIVSSVVVPSWQEVQEKLQGAPFRTEKQHWAYAMPPFSLMLTAAKGHEVEINLAVAYVQLGLLKEARTLLNYLITVQKAYIEIRGAATSWDDLIRDYYVASVVEYLDNNLDEAITIANSAVHYASKWSRLEPQLFTQLLLGRLLLEKGEEEKVFAICSSGLEESFAVQSVSRDKAKAILAGHYVRILEEDVVHWTYAWQYAALLGDTFATMGKNEKALNAMRCALDLLEMTFKRSQTASQDLTSVWPLQWQYPFASCIDLLMRKKDLKDSREALTIAERAKSRTLLNLLQAVSLTGQSSWVTPPTIKIDMKTAVRILRDNEAVFEYYISDKTVYLWVLTRNGQKSISVAYPKNKLLHDIIEMRSSLESPDLTVRQKSRSMLKKLYETIVLPGIRGLPSNVDTLIIVPSGPLWYLPFSALIMTDQGRVSNDSLGIRCPYLVERYDLAYLPSLAALSYLGTSTVSGTRESLFALANPALSPSEQQEVGEEYLYKELEQAARSFARCLTGRETDVYTLKAATEERAKDESLGIPVTLFACHGKFDPLNPLYSVLYLAPSGNQDGYYYAWEVYNTKHTGTGLVVLAACESLLPAFRELEHTLGNKFADERTLMPWQLDKLTTGDEVVGLARAFLSSGAGAVLGTLWQANPKAVGKLLSLACRYYRQGKEKSWAKALASAQRDLIRDTAFSDPWFWAPYQLIGRWR